MRTFLFPQSFYLIFLNAPQIHIIISINEQLIRNWSQSSRWQVLNKIVKFQQIKAQILLRNGVPKMAHNHEKKREKSVERNQLAKMLKLGCANSIIAELTKLKQPPTQTMYDIKSFKKKKLKYVMKRFLFFRQIWFSN